MIMNNFLYILHILGMATVVGGGIAVIALKISTKDMAAPERSAFMLRAFFISRFGAVAFLVLIITGVMMLMPHWSALKGMPVFHIKLTLIVVQIILLGFTQMYMAKAKREVRPDLMLRISRLGFAMTINAVLVVICAILVFH